jgi:hypothetical protein
MGASFKKYKNDLGLGKYCINRLMLTVSFKTNQIGIATLHIENGLKVFWPRSAYLPGGSKNVIRGC